MMRIIKRQLSLSDAFHVCIQKTQNFMIKSKAADQEGGTQEEAITVKAPTSLIEREEEEEDRQLIAWQENFEAVHQQWQRVWDEDSQSYYYVHQITGESSWEPPAIDALAVIARRDEGLAEAPEIKALVTKTVRRNLMYITDSRIMMESD